MGSFPNGKKLATTQYRFGRHANLKMLSKDESLNLIFKKSHFRFLCEISWFLTQKLLKLFREWYKKTPKKYRELDH